MGTTIYVLVTACVCLIVGIYFVFVRGKKGEQTPAQE